MSAMQTAAEPARVLVVDDEETAVRNLVYALGKEGYAVTGLDSGTAALAALEKERFDVVLTDLRMERVDGMQVLRQARERYPDVAVIVLTGYATVTSAVDAMKEGAFHYVTKPFRLDEVRHVVREAAELSRLRRENRELRAAVEGLQGGGAIITRDPAMQRLLETARQVAAADCNVFITGESGTGKELLAQAIHRASPRAGRPFVAINCSAIPETLLESELFGHVKGAFTGAARDHRGLFQAADGGTLFLDEIGDMPPALQVKLLRVLQERSVRPVGSTTPVAIDVRVVSATHRDLEALLADGSFREDLFYRLAVVTLTLPTLAERREDIPLLAQHFLAALSARHGRRVNGFAPEALRLLATAAWPGNVRQLHNVVEQVVALATTPLVSAALVQRALRVPGMQVLSYAEARRRFEHDYLVDLLKLTDGNVADAARLAERNRTEFYRLLQKHGLTPGRFRGDVADDEDPVADRRQ